MSGSGQTTGIRLRLCAAAALLAAVFLGLSAAGWGGGQSTTGSWRTLREAGFERTEVGAARIGSSIYVVGGFQPPSRTTAAMERYDIRRDRWRRMPPMPIAVNHPAVTALGGRLYVFGGYTAPGFGPVTGALQRFDPRTDRWRLLAPSPTPRGAAAMVSLGGDLYAVGGAAEEAMRTLEVFDVDSGRWSAAPSMRVAREHIAAVATGDGLYVFGGRSAGRNLAVVERFDPRLRRWSRLPHLIQARSGFAAVAVDGRPVVFGGEELTQGGETIASVELYDPPHRRWRLLPPMRTPRHGLGGAALGRRIYALEGGPTPGLDFSSTIEYLDIAPKPSRRR